MADNFAAIVGLFSCPDDGSSMLHAAGELHCSSCARRFPILAGNLAEILPQRPFDLSDSVNSSYREGYFKAFEQIFQFDDTSLAWGAEETMPWSWACKRRRQVAVVRPFVVDGTAPAESILCDVAAGAGYYTFAYAHLFRYVLHCDLSVDNLNYAWHKARALGIQNIFFIRADYFALPFRRSVDRVLCLDSLIRGEAHDSALLTGIARSLKSQGFAITDFHNWWHNPLRRLGLLPENFHQNRSYRRSEAEQLLRRAGVNNFSFRPFLQEFDPDSAVAGFLSGIFPSTRLVYRFAPPAPETCVVAFENMAGAPK
jgi:SAM-dependent methyltransferase